MTTTRIADVIVPEQWTPAFLLASPELIALFQSGIVSHDDVIAAFANGEGSTFHIRHINDLLNVEENSSSDDPTELSTPQNVTEGEQLAVKLSRNQSWSSMDLVAALSSPDPVSVIRSRVASYWAHRFQKATIAIGGGILASNIANNGADMLFDGSAAPISGEAILNAKATMGDAAGALTSIAMHSVQYTALQKQNLIVYLRDGNADVHFPTYLGYRVVQDDGMPVDTSGAAPVYTSMLFGNGVFRLGMGQPKVPVEVHRYPDRGNGGGEEVFHSRQQFILHPAGFSYVAKTANPKNATFTSGATWERIFQRKQLPLAFLKTK
ncbi:major capsid protein [Dyella caseinilytica]|uniref:Major capsid protein E n=1 Tax=Dyella caseinilytica TaxID=1849581 RepID=A0ABX7GPS3_9GAMM|nr:hypothetical protein [Dyella caseinilytica]QRN52397.1 hypothetical protein ISN74_13015 [Dyella caseinilytica]GGA05637.1 hypothetical protein GCM10011408_28200 [Dyella caseinilytica]